MSGGYVSLNTLKVAKNANSGGENSGQSVVASLEGKIRNYSFWQKDNVLCLIEWFETAGNYDLWKGSGEKNQNGTKVTTGRTKASILADVVDHLKKKGFENSTESVSNKIKHLEKSWKDANLELAKTGEGITEEDEKMKIDGIRAKILRTCPFWDRLDPIYCDRPCMVPPHVSDNMDQAEDASQFLLGINGQEPADKFHANDFYDEPDNIDYQDDGSNEADNRDDTPSKNAAPSKRKLESSGSRESNSISKRGPGKGMSLGQAVLLLGKEQAAAQTRRLEMEEIKMDNVKQQTAWQQKKERAELELKREELSIRRLEAENQRMMLQIQMSNQSGRPN